MNISDNQLDQLFSQAREQEPVASLDETKKAFLTATIAAAGGVLATKGILKLLTAKKWIIMLSTISIVTTGSIVVGLSMGPKTTSETPQTIPTVNTVIEQEKPEPKTDSFPADYYLERTPMELVKNERDDLFELVENEPALVEGSDIRVESDTNKTEVIVERSIKSDKKLLKSQEKIKSFEERYKINQNTTEEELEEIKTAAKEVGIDFSYRAKYSKDRMTKLRLEMRLNDENGDRSEYIMTSMTIDNDFDYTVAWDRDDNGRVNDIYCGSTEELDQDIEGAIEEALEEIELALEEIELALEEIEFEELMLHFDSIGVNIAAEMELEWAAIERELEQNREEIERAWEEIDREEINAVLEQITESSEELIETIEEELKELKEELEEAKEEEKQKQKEEKEKEKEKNKEKEKQKQ